MSDELKNVHGYNIGGSESGMEALESFDPDEARVIIGYAQKHKKAKFEHSGKDYTLLRKSDGSFEVQPRSTGWF